MQIAPRIPFGVEIAGVDLAAIDDATLERLAHAVAAAGVAVIRDQTLDDAAFAAWLARLGPPIFTEGETPVPGAPTLNVVTNAGRTTPPRSVFHTDTSYVSEPPAFTALRPVELPRAGGATLFTDQYAAFERLPTATREELMGATVRHGVTGVADTGGQERTARHPLFRRHPLTGRVAVYLSTPERCGDVSGLTDESSAALVELLYREATAAPHVLRHDWRRGDVLIWDNRCTMHRADHSGVDGRRTLHRGMVRGEAPIAA